jgi:hypothetical protein
MRGFFQRWSGLLWVAVLALVIVRTADAHMHLCLDGDIQRTSVHVSDTAGVCDSGDDSQTEHQDQDVNVFGAALAKKSADADVVNLPAILPVVLALLPLQRAVVPHDVTDDPAPKLPYLFLPLLRGPPV